MKFDIITVGGAVVDAFLETDLAEVKGKLDISVGGKFLVDDISFGTGGGGTNTAAAFSKLGLKTGFVGKLGRDGNAEIVLKELKKFGVKFLGSFSNEPTGFSVVVDSKKQNRTILTYKGANNFLDFDSLSLRKLKTRWFYFSSSVGKSLKAQEKLARWAKRNGILVAYNPSSYLTARGANVLKGLLRNVEVLVLNEEEARHLVRRGDLIRGLHASGPKIVAITRGEKGVIASDGVKLYSPKVHRVKAVEQTGAGDAFAAGFVTGLIKLGDVEKACKIGLLNSEKVIQELGAKNGLLTWKQVSSKLKLS